MKKLTTDMNARLQEKRKKAQEKTHATSIFISSLFTTPALFISMLLLGFLMKQRVVADYGPLIAGVFGGIGLVCTVLVSMKNRTVGYFFSMLCLLVCALAIGLGIYLIAFAPRLDPVTIGCLVCAAIGLYLSVDTLKKFKVAVVADEPAEDAAA
jgi:FtsH-binding integral membrane protein